MSFQVQWTWVEVLVVLSVITLVVFWESRFQSNRRRLLRISLWMLAVLALVCLYLEPVSQIPAPKRVGSVFSAPISKSEKDSLLQNRNLIEIADPLDLLQLPYSINEVQVFGDGLEPWQLNALQGYSTIWQAPELTEGITSIHIPKITEGIPFSFSGEAFAKEDVKLTLTDPEGRITSLVVNADESQFQFTSQVNTAGLFEYQLLGLRDLDTLFSETLPVQVEPSGRADLLLLGAFPSFEWNYLKNHLADLGFGVASRFQLSKEVFHSEFLNMPAANLKTLNSKLIEQFKLLILDGKTFEALDNSQKRQIFTALELAEVGLFLMIDDLSELQSVAAINSIQGSGELTVSTSGNQIELLKIPFSINDRHWNPITFQNQEIGAFTQRGIGKIGFSMIANSHVLELQGAPEIYGQLWDQLLSPVIGFDIDDGQYYMPQFHFVDRQTDISFSSFDQPDVSIDGLKVPPINSPIRPDLWTVSYWPKRRGWHTIQVNEQDKEHFFVHSSGEWKQWQRFEKQRYNRLFYETNQYEDKPGKLATRAVTPWIPFLIFLIALTGLWLERKLS